MKEYRKQRDFKKTREPFGKPQNALSENRFVVQKHDARQLHYDFRLEIDGVLKSWAVPKGFPFKVGEKHLAMEVEDHPLEYADFEGIIPEGNYGGGTVMLWDRGYFESLGGSPEKDLEKGKIHFELQGEKLKGEWALIKMKHGDSGREWLLLKSGESMPPVGKKRDNQSVISGRSMKQIARDRNAEWTCENGAKEPPVREKLSELPSEKPVFISPMKAKFVDSSPSSGDWRYEFKFDGYRALAIKNGKSVRLLSRNEKSLAAKFSNIVGAVLKLHVQKAVLDGEIVALDVQGRPSFQLLQRYEMEGETPLLRYYLFDLLHLDGKNLRGLPLDERKSMLKSLLENAPSELLFSENIKGKVSDILTEVRKLGLEGLVGKRAGSNYEAGKRSGAWIKLKVLNEQEFVIGGYTRPQGSRKHFGALIVGYYEEGKLLAAGKVGTGFSDSQLIELHSQFQGILQKESPFANLPMHRKGRQGQGITKTEMKRCTWLKPELVCQVRFTEWTEDGGLRHPVFIGMRDDRPAKQVGREM